MTGQMMSEKFEVDMLGVQILVMQKPRMWNGGYKHGRKEEIISRSEVII